MLARAADADRIQLCQARAQLAIGLLQPVDADFVLCPLLRDSESVIARVEATQLIDHVQGERGQKCDSDHSQHAARGRVGAHDDVGWCGDAAAGH